MLKRQFYKFLRFILLLWGNSAVALASEVGVLATIKPLQLIISQITQDVTQESSPLLPPGMTPHDFALKISDLKRIKQADLVLWLGPKVEPYLVKIMNNKAASQQLNLSTLPAIQRLGLRSLAGGYHHENSELDPHIWLSPENGLHIANALVEKLSALDGQNAHLYQQNLAYFKRDLKQLDTFRNAFAKQQADYVVHHDAYQYLEVAMGLMPAAVVTSEPEISPGVRHLTELVELIRERNIQCFVAGPGLSPRLVSLLFKGQPASSYRVIELDALAGGPVTSYVSFIKDLSARLSDCVRGKAGGFNPQ